MLLAWRCVFVPIQVTGVQQDPLHGPLRLDRSKSTVRCREASPCTRVSANPNGASSNGRLLLHGEVRALLDALQAASRLDVLMAEPADAAAAAGLLRRQPGVAGVETDHGLLRVVAEQGLDAGLFRLLGQSGYAATRFGRRPATLDDLYCSVAAG